MKKNLMLVLIVTSLSLVLNSTSAQYIDLASGKNVALVKHEGNGLVYNTETQRPVFLYINPATRDTFYGRTGENINGKVMRSSNGRYSYPDENYVYKDGEYQLKTEVGKFGTVGYKKKMENDGSIKIKDGDSKTKIGDDGDIKVKDNYTKIKAEGNGELKVKDGEYRKKIDQEGNRKEKDNNGKIKENADGSVKVKDGNYKGKEDDNGNIKEKDTNYKRKVRNGKEKVKETEDGEVKVKTKQ